MTTKKFQSVERMSRQYQYVGPAEIAKRVVQGGGGFVVDSMNSLRSSLGLIDGYSSGEPFVVTFVIGLDGRLRIADRRSEHVKCANGEPVLSAGEMTLICDASEFIVERVTNQSTGYCPEPESWQAVVDAIVLISNDYPESFDPAFLFRKCPSCSQINIVKDEWYFCEVCQSPLPTEWNFQ